MDAQGDDGLYRKTRRTLHIFLCIPISADHRVNPEQDDGSQANDKKNVSICDEFPCNNKRDIERIKTYSFSRVSTIGSTKSGDHEIKKCGEPFVFVHGEGFMTITN